MFIYKSQAFKKCFKKTMGFGFKKLNKIRQWGKWF